MPAFAYEYTYMKQDGVQFEWHAQPVRIVENDGVACGVEFVHTRPEDPSSRRSKLSVIPGSEFIVEADMIVKALGQEPLDDLINEFPGLKVADGRIVADPATGATSVPGLFAGGDCISKGAEIVNAVQEGKIGAAGMHARLTV